MTEASILKAARHDSVEPSRTSVVIALYNGATTLAVQLDALCHQSCSNFEIIVADNGSTDDGPAVARAHKASPLVVEATSKRGTGHARNAGAAAATSDKLLFCDDDDIVDHGWVEAMSHALDRWDLVGGLIETESLNSRTHQWRTPPEATTLAQPLPYVGGGNFGIRRDVFEALGGWPEDLVFSAEDIVLCWKAQLAGYSLGYEARAIVHWRYREHLLAHARQEFEYGFDFVGARMLFPQFGPPRLTPWWKTLGWMVANVHLAMRYDTVGAWVGSMAHRVGQGRALARISGSAQSPPGHGGSGADC